MTFGDVDHLNDRALESLDRVEHEPRLTPQEPLDEPRPYAVSDRDALANADAWDQKRASR